MTLLLNGREVGLLEEGVRLGIENKIIYKGTELLVKISEKSCLGEIYFNEDFGYAVVGMQNLGEYALQALANENGNLFENREGLEVALLLSTDWERMFELEEELSPINLEDIGVLNRQLRDSKRKEGVAYLFQNMEGLDEIGDVDKVGVGSYAYSNYTRMWYVVAELPNLIEKNSSVFALVRLDGQGYFFKRESLQELLSSLKTEMDAGEVEMFEGFICR